MPPDDQDNLRIEWISEEAIKTSEMEGEILDRDSVQSSLRQQLGLGTERPGIKPAERGISQMMADPFKNFAAPLDAEALFAWHAMLMSGNRTIGRIGYYRTHADPMQVVSGPDYKRTVHFEAPPSARVPDEMQRFIAWFNATALGEKSALPALTRAAHAPRSLRGARRNARTARSRWLALTNPQNVAHVVVAAERPITLAADELDDYKEVPLDKLRPWRQGTGPGLRDWLVARGYDPQVVDFGTPLEL